MNCCNHNKMPRPVRGNAFNVAVTVVARRIDGTVIDDFALTSEAVLNVTHGTSSTEKEYTIIGQNVAVIHFDGTDAAGIYGVEFIGEWSGEPWRFAVPVVFQIVELTTQGWLPQDGIIYEPTYEVDAEIVIAGGGGGGDVQADWTETDPDSPAYIQHKPDIYTQAQTDALLAGKLNGFEIIECNITAVDSAGRATVDNENWYAQALAAYNAKKIPVIYGQAISEDVRYSMILTVEKHTAAGIDDYRIYGSAAITIGGSSPRRKILYAEMQSTHSNASIYLSDFVDKLVSGQNIKTINGNSLVGSGNVTIPTGLTVAYEVVDAGTLYLDQTETYYEVPATVYTALKTVWDAEKVPVLTGSLFSHTTGFALIPTSEDGSRFYCFFHAYNTMQGGIRWQLSGTISSTGGRLYPEEEQKPITVDQSVIAGSQNPVSSTGVKTYVDSALAGKQDKLTFDDTPTAGSTNPVKSSGVKAADDAVRRSFYEAAGAVYNATTGYYELNGLTDITEEQMAEIYAIGRGFNYGKDNDYKFAYQRLRTNLLPITSGLLNCGVYTVYSANNAVCCRCMFGYTSTFEVVVVGIGKTGTEMGFYPLDATSMFVNCSNLRTVLGVLKMKYCNAVSGMFTACSSLRTIKLSEVKIDISFAASPLLYYSSLFYLVDKASNTTAITVTVHADVYAKLTRTYEGSVMTKIQQEANETGQVATTLAQSWASLSSVAAGKNISFAEP